ncbi:MAG: glycosyltransferase [Defluviitaleaceae bacterium]|nr:glycosyltransferase [Defluviitaleaceae bacterium]
MRVWLFPFKQIKKDSRIVIYAAGAVGRAYYQQLKLTNYADVVLWVDKHVTQKDVNSIDMLIAENSSNYDLILIAANDENTADNIKTELISLGIESGKIVYEKPTCYYSTDFVGLLTKLSLADILLKNHKAISTVLDEYQAYGRGKLDFFSEIIREMSAYAISEDGRSKELNTLFIEYIETFKPSPQQAIILLCLLYKSNCFFSDTLRLLVKYTSLLDMKIPQAYGMFCDISEIWAHRPRSLYDEFFIEFKNLGHKIATSWTLSWDTKPYEMKNNKRICILVHSFLSGPLAPIISQIANGLINKGYELHIVNIESLVHEKDSNFLAHSIVSTSNSNSPSSRTSIIDYASSHVIYHEATNHHLRDRQQELLNIIASTHPLCVIDYSISFGLVTYYVSQHYPVIELPGRKSGYSSSFFHKHLSYNDDGFHAPIAANQAITQVPPHYEMQEIKRIHSRSEYGFDDDDIICITVGNRLDFDLSKNLFDSMLSILNKNRTLKWLIVGTESLPWIKPSSLGEISRSIHFIPYEEDLTGLYQICDIYINPLRTGGGTSVAWAALSGVAVVTPAEACDACTIVGSVNCVENESDISARVYELSITPALLSQQKSIMKNISSTWGMKKLVARIEEEVLKLVNEFSEGTI